jgi:ABC-type sugar transport system ATPase subunit
MAHCIALRNDGRLQDFAVSITAFDTSVNRFFGEILRSPAMNTFEADLNRDSDEQAV